MNNHKKASEQITEQVTLWPGVKAGTGRQGELSFTVGRHEIGHLHGDGAAHFGFPQKTGAELREQGLVDPHLFNPSSPKVASRRITNESDIQDVIKLMELNYNRIVDTHGLPEEIPSNLD